METNQMTPNEKSVEQIAEEQLPFYSIQYKYFQGKPVVDDEQYDEKTLLNQQIAKDRVILAEAILSEREKVKRYREALEFYADHSRWSDSQMNGYTLSHSQFNSGGLKGYIKAQEALSPATKEGKA